MSGGMSSQELLDRVIVKHRVASNILSEIGVPASATNIEHMSLFLVLMQQYYAKNAVHNDLWKQYGWQDSLQHVRSKYLRTQQQADKVTNGGITDDLDDPMDLIQYTMFFLRNVMAGNRHGPNWQGEEDTADIITAIATRKGEPEFVAAVMEALR